MTGAGVLDFYRGHSAVTDPRGYAYLFDDLPGHLPALVRVVQGLLVHSLAVGLYGVPPCKRVSFARYLPGPGATIHEIAQCWDASQRRWRLVDPGNDETITASQQAYFASIGQPSRAVCDTLDLGQDDFIPAAVAWRRCRDGSADAGQFGYGDDRGERWLRITVLQDLDALNKAELNSYDSWGGPLVSEPGISPAGKVRYLDRAETTPAEARFLDQMAELATDPDQHLWELRRRYCESAWGRGVLDTLSELAS